jgi:hypothetical protein
MKSFGELERSFKGDYKEMARVLRNRVEELECEVVDKMVIISEYERKYGSIDKCDFCGDYGEYWLYKGKIKEYKVCRLCEDTAKANY